jgi:hypothetical protein
MPAEDKKQISRIDLVHPCGSILTSLSRQAREYPALAHLAELILIAAVEADAMNTSNRGSSGRTS